MHYAATIALLLLAVPAAAQDDATTYMGIDLTAQPQPVSAAAPEARSVDADMRDMLDEGVELGCLSFEPPASFSQTDDTGDACRAYISRLAAATSGEAEAEQQAPPAETPDPQMARGQIRWPEVPLVLLAQAAQSGNKQAQLELGRRFEEGTGGVERNWDHALELYREAGRATPARQGLRVGASVEAGAGGAISRGTLSPRIPGLPEARERLEALEARIEAGER